MNAPQFEGMTGEVRIEVCVEGGSVMVKVDKRVVNGEIGPWRGEVKQCWEDGREVYCGEP